MGRSTIEWCTDTWGPVTGCTQFSKECKNCYAKELAEQLRRKGKAKYKNGFDKVVTHDYTLNIPYSWKSPKTIFVNSMSDLFHKDVPLEFIKKVFTVMNQTPQHTYQVLTKRDNLLVEYSEQLEWGSNIWQGVSVGSLASKSKIDNLRKCGAKHKFLSIEPLIEDLGELDLTGIELVLVGGESGSGDGIRPMKLEWVENIQRQALAQNVQFFFKQWGINSNNPDANDPTMAPCHPFHSKGGCLLNGKIVRENPCIKGYSVNYLQAFDNEYLVVNRHDDLHLIWELQSHLPMMAPDAYNKLKDDIRLNGLNDPVLFWVTPNGEKLVIDGHTRLETCKDLKMKSIPSKDVQAKFTSLEEIKVWMIEHQAKRRNLTEIERMDLALLSKPTIEKMARENQVMAGKLKGDVAIAKPINTTNEIARIAGVSATNLSRYLSIQKHASNTVKEQVRKGQMSVYSAYQICKRKIDTCETDSQPIEGETAKFELKPVTIVSTKPSKENAIVEFDSVQEAMVKYQAGELDMVLREPSQVNYVRRNQKLVIGVVKLQSKEFLDVMPTAS